MLRLIAILVTLSAVGCSPVYADDYLVYDYTPEVSIIFSKTPCAVGKQDGVVTVARHANGKVMYGCAQYNTPVAKLVRIQWAVKDDGTPKQEGWDFSVIDMDKLYPVSTK